MNAVLLWVGVLALAVGVLIDRNDRKRIQAVEDLDRERRLADLLLTEEATVDVFGELDSLWCAEHGIGWPAEGPVSLPMRPVRHSSNRLHRGF